MTTNEPVTRHHLQAKAEDIIRRLPDMGKLMIIGKGKGATHERIGKVEMVGEVSGRFVCGGAHHKSSIDPTLVCEIVFDISSIMQNQVYPRLEFNKADGGTLFAVVGFEGLEPFANVLSDLQRTVDPKKRDLTRPDRPDLDPADPGRLPLDLALAEGSAITIRYDEPGFSQSWTGPVTKVSPGMGFINIMTEDFHLHLLGGTVARWEETEVAEGRMQLAAINHEGQLVGLTLLVPAFEDAV